MASHSFLGTGAAAQARHSAHYGSISHLPVRYLQVPAAVRPHSADDDPAIYGDSIAFAAQYPTARLGQTGMFAGTAGRWHPQRLFVTRPPESEIDYTRLSARWLTWVQYAGSAWTIRAMDRVSHRISVIDSSSREGPLPADVYFPHNSLYGNTFAWSYTTCTDRCRGRRPKLRAAVLTRQLPRGPVRVIRRVTGRCLPDWPSVWQGIVAFQMDGECWGAGHKVGSDVYIARLSTGHVRRITFNHGSSEPAINGQELAWKQGPPGSTAFQDGMIVLMDLGTNRRVVASVRMAGPNHAICWPRNTKIQTCADEPVVTSHVLVWTLNNGTAIMARDLSSGRQYTVYVQGGTGSPVAYRPRNAWGREVVWQAVVPVHQQPQLELGLSRIP